MSRTTVVSRSDRLAGALAVARCDYLAKCYSLAPYRRRRMYRSDDPGEIDWIFTESCTLVAGATNCAWNMLKNTFPSPALFEAIAAGRVTYDPQKRELPVWKPSRLRAARRGF